MSLDLRRGWGGGLDHGHGSPQGSRMATERLPYAGQLIVRVAPGGDHGSMNAAARGSRPACLDQIEPPLQVRMRAPVDPSLIDRER
ncbi:hypothetical protein AB7008_07920 [Bradyrhizobium sp. 521_C7_N1_3]|uniref:Uncharacterized protein n=3 Tax=Bradyrhizobium TaxID=374 RepID=A0A837CU66_9BRAD|nr:hypothetical protein [Bradyrhizobium japonicum]AHY48480.1 hypothetical protein BJS_08294 [Bradyrhizobium japonicum SEMIA 5079]AJA65520.1 hypothetical protein RN69_38560 [Bradyrhizobium japonicum]KGJ71513.1 hypothetical protein BJA5080_08016 [Bradyrhizobium diazoefficiens SEMIA 5080]